jgi:hypothetical protein
MFNLTSNLKQSVPLHGYIDKIASNSPYYKARKGMKGQLNTRRRDGSNETMITPYAVPVDKFSRGGSGD